MAGRGTRVGGYGEKKVPVRRPGEVTAAPAIAQSVSVITLLEKINSINVTNADPVLLNETEELFVKLCSNANEFNRVIRDLHSQALSDPDFGEKMAMALYQLIKSSFQVDGTHLKKAIINLLQDDFEAKYSDYQSDRQKYMNAANLLGNFYRYMRAGTQPIYVMGEALLEYMNNLLRGSEEELKVVATQVLINNKNLLANANKLSDKYELLKKSLRKRLIGNDLTSKSRCWILLCLDHMSNNLRYLQGNLREFYVENVGQDFLELEMRVKNIDRLKGGNPKQCTSTVGTFKPGGLGDLAKNHLTSCNTSDSVSKKHVEKRDLLQDFNKIHIKDKNLNNKGFELEGRQWRERKGGNWRKKLDNGRNMKALDDKKVTSPKESLSQFKNDDFYGVQLPVEKDDILSKLTGIPAGDTNDNGEKSPEGKNESEVCD